MPSSAEVQACTWLTEAELNIYATEYARTGFQASLNWYHCRTSRAEDLLLQAFSGQAINVPSCFIAGAKDWGIHQVPGVLEAMQTEACSRMTSCDLVANAGHWVQQEQPEAVVGLLFNFLSEVSQKT